MNYFEVFGLERRLAIDLADLQRRFYELSRRHHPDFHQGAAPAEQARALEASALVNAAYRTLRDPVARVEYLVRLEEGRETREGATAKPQAPPALLREMFEIQEALQEAKAGGLGEADREVLAAQRERLLVRHRDEEARLTGPLSEAWNAGGPVEHARLLAELKDSLATLAYLKTVIDDLGTVLGGDQETHVSHRRH